MSRITSPHTPERTRVDEAPDERWVDVGAVADVPLDRGVAVLVDPTGEPPDDDGVGSSAPAFGATAVPVALFRLSGTEGTDDDEWFAVSHIDPVTDAPVMARGLVGSVAIGDGDIATIASPLHKQRYDLRTGQCLDDDTLSLESFDVRVTNGRVLLRRIVGRSHAGHVDETSR